MASNNGNANSKLSYLERMKRLKSHNEKQRIALFGAPEQKKVDEKNELMEQPQQMMDTVVNKENESILMNDTHRGNRTAPAGDLSVMGASILSNSSNGSGVAESMSLLADCGPSARRADESANNCSRGSSVIDIPRDGALSTNCSLLASFNQGRADKGDFSLITDQASSFSRPREPEARRPRTESGEANIPPYRERTSSGQHEEKREDRNSRVMSHNGSFARSKSAAAMEPFATPAFNRNAPSIGGMASVTRGGGHFAPRTPGGLMQTPSLLRSSFSTSSLSSTPRMNVNGRDYAILSRLGKGGSSEVFSGYDEELSMNVAIKVVDLSNADDNARRAYVNECELLESLQGCRHVITMHDYELRENESTLYVVMEKGDADLATFLRTKRGDITPAFRKYWWEEMLRAVKVIHDKNIVHSDLKPANFLLVGGNLKLIDFGIASSIPSNKTSVVKDTQMGTLSYMSPESLTGVCEGDADDSDGEFFKLTHKSDVWSLGCILFLMVYGRTPFEHCRTQSSKIRAICDPKMEILFDDVGDEALVSAIKRCLVRDVKKRASVDELLKHAYLVSTPSSSEGPVCSSPISDNDIAQFAVKLKSFTPRTATRKLKEFMNTAATKGTSSSASSSSVLSFDSPPSTK